MIQNQIDPYIRVCMKAWLMCESAIHTELKQEKPREELLRACGDCGRSCFTLVSQLASDQPFPPGDRILECLIDCRQCARTCEDWGENEDDFELCKEACLHCADFLKDILPIQAN
jgi:hypothetical protein